MAGVFVNYQLSEIFKFRGELNYYNPITPFRVSNKDKKDFLGEPIVISSVVGNPTLEVPLLLRIKLPLKIPKTEIGFQGGLNCQFIFKSNDGISLPRYPEETKIIHALYNSPKSVMAVPTYGVFVVLFDRAEINAKYTRISDYFRDVDYNGKRYRINSLAEYFFVSVGYRFYSFKRGNALKKKE